MSDAGQMIREPEESRVWQALPVVALAVVVLSFLVNEIYSIDIWWQIAIGRDILATKSIPTVDRYSVAALGQAYHDSHWLFQIVVATAHGLAAWVGVQAVMVAIWSAALLFCFGAARSWVGSTAAAILVFLAAMVSVERFLPRPEIVTFLGVATFYYLLQEGRFRSARDVALLALTQIIWANSHGLFVIGPFMVGCYWLPCVVGKVRGRDDGDFGAILRALIGVTISTLITPFGARGWWYAGVLSVEAGPGGPEVMQHLGELSGTFGEATRSSPAFWFYLVVLGLTGLAAVFIVARRRFSPRLLIVAALCAASFTGRRNVVLLALVAAPFIAESLSLMPSLGRRLSTRWAAGISAAVLLCFAWYPLSGAYYLQMELPARSGLGVTPSFFPHGLPAFLDDVGFDGNVLNSNTLGGFHLYHGYPKRLPLTDGRWETYDPEVLTSVLRGSRSGGAWRQIVERFELSGLLLAHTSPEARAILPDLRRSSEWRLVYLDHAASFWVRDEGSASLPAVDLENLESIPSPRRFDDGLILNAFFAGVGATGPRIMNLERTLEFGEREQLLLEQLGPLLLETHRNEEAGKVFEHLLAIDPKSEIALNELAFLAYVRGDRDEAVRLMEKLLEIAPENTDYRENYRRLTRQGAYD